MRTRQEPCECDLCRDDVVEPRTKRDVEVMVRMEHQRRERKRALVVDAQERLFEDARN